MIELGPAPRRPRGRCAFQGRRRSDLTGMSGFRPAKTGFVPFIAGTSPDRVGAGRGAPLGRRRHAHRLRERRRAPATRRPSRLAADGIDFGASTTRFVKPLDTATILRAIRQCPLVVTVEEGTVHSAVSAIAVLEAAAEAGLDASHVRRLGIPDATSRTAPQRASGRLGIGRRRIVRACRQWTGRAEETAAGSRRSHRREILTQSRPVRIHRFHPRDGRRGAFIV